jgi:hypothetical protein
MVKLVLKLALFGLVANALYQGVPPFYNHWKFQDRVRELASFPPRGFGPAEIADRCALIAREHDIPLGKSDFVVQMTGTGRQAAVKISAAYDLDIAYFPGQPRNHVFALDVEGEPPRYGTLN